MTEIERGILGERTDRRNWFIYAVKPEGEKGRIIAACYLCPEDYPTKDDFFKTLILRRKEFAEKYGPGSIGDGTAGSFIDFVANWNDELALGGEDLVSSI